MEGTEIENGSSPTPTPTPPPQNAADVRRQYGVTNPISFAGPTEADIHRNSLLEKVSQLHFIFHSKFFLKLFK